MPALAAPARLVCEKRECTQVRQVKPTRPAFPAQWLYGLLRALPGVRAVLPTSPPGSGPGSASQRRVIRPTRLDHTPGIHPPAAPKASIATRATLRSDGE